MSQSGVLLKRHGYRQLKKIGEGSFGQALLVENVQNSAKLVCKLINVSQASPKEVQDTRTEAQLLAAFKHPFIVEYCDNFLDSGWLCILMTFCEGGDLTTQVELARKAKHYIVEAQVMRWMTQALLALKYIHDKHVLHRDLKSGNFFLSKVGNLKMGDFGIAKVLTCTQAVARTQIGTPYYLSPEVCQDKPYAWASDIWAMGVILYELCALKLPFDGGSNMIVLVQAICRGPTPAIPDSYSDWCKRLCHEMLSKSAACRPSAGAILARPECQRIVATVFQEAKEKAASEQAEKGVQQAQAGAPARGASPQPGGSQYKQGDLVEYWSNTHQAWLAAVITKSDGTCVSIDLKPNTMMTLEQQAKSLRQRGQVEQTALVADVPVAQKVAEAVSTSVLEQMLGEVGGESQARPPARPAPQTPSVATEAPGTADSARPAPPKVGISVPADTPSLDEECEALLEELGVDNVAVPPSPTVQLSQEEMDILNDSLLNGSCN